MNPNAANPAKILVTTDLSEGAACAFPYATALARSFDSDLTLLHVVTGYSEYLLENEPILNYEEIVRERAHRKLDELELVGAHDLPVQKEVVRAWSAKDGISTYAEDAKPDLIVMSSHGHGRVARFFLGSVTGGVVAAVSQPVLCVKCDGCGMLDDQSKEIRISRILVPVDLSDESRRALRLASEYARTYDAQLHLMYVIHVDVPPGILSQDSARYFEISEIAHTRVSERLTEFQREVDPDLEKVVTMVEKGSPVKHLTQYAEANSVDLIIVGRKGLGRTRHQLGCVAGRLLRDTNCPTLVI